jgi:hypothetical protein
MMVLNVLDALSERTDLTIDQVIDAIYLSSKSEIFSLETIGANIDKATHSDISSRTVKYDIFLSYADGDSRLADELKTEFEIRGLRWFMAKKDIEVASEWEISIREALISCTWVLLLLTPRSIDRPWVLLESGAAWGLGKRLVPVLVQVSISNLIDPIRKYQARLIKTMRDRQDLIEGVITSQ